MCSECSNLLKKLQWKKINPRQIDNSRRFYFENLFYLFSISNFKIGKAWLYSAKFDCNFELIDMFYQKVKKVLQKDKILRIHSSKKLVQEISVSNQTLLPHKYSYEFIYLGKKSKANKVMNRADRFLQTEQLLSLNPKCKLNFQGRCFILDDISTTLGTLNKAARITHEKMKIPISKIQAIVIARSTR